MGLHVLLADPREFVRRGMRAFLLTIPIIEDVYEATSYEELKEYLRSCLVNLVVVHQALVVDITAFQGWHFVILTKKLDEHAMLSTYRHNGLGYLLEDASTELLRLILYLAVEEGERMFLLDPVIVPYLFDEMSEEVLLSDSSDLNKLTSREREILYLMYEGCNDSDIAERLYISQITVRTHIAHILQKLQIKRDQVKHLHLRKDKP